MLQIGQIPFTYSSILRDLFFKAIIFLVRLNPGKYSFLIVINTNIRTIRPANLSSMGIEENKNTGETKVAAINNIA